VSRRNREKRAAKQKARLRAAAAERRSDAFFASADRVILEALVVEAIRAAAMCPEHEVEWHVAELLADFGSVGVDLDAAADVAVSGAVRGAWEAGWLPVDVVEIARRKLAEPAAVFVAEAIVIEARQYPSIMVHPRWRASHDAATAAVDAGVASRHMRSWSGRHGSRSASLTMALEVLALLLSLPVLQRLLPLPGESRHSVASASEVDEKALAKVRALLAKAESTEFADEAEALTAKAQELVSRYSLHQAVLDHDRGRAPQVAGRRLWIEAPYAAPKAHLVQTVAQANRCRAVWSENLGFVTVVGGETELDLVELLATSLMVQASRAMLAAGRDVGRRGTSRTRSFRQSFLIAYAARIGERLATASSTAAAEMSVDDRLLPVLAARSRAADDLVATLFPQLVHRPMSVSNAAGWGAGRAAADQAQLNVLRAVAG
jgi:hypothetical protein